MKTEHIAWDSLTQFDRRRLLGAADCDTYPFPGVIPDWCSLSEAQRYRLYQVNWSLCLGWQSL